MSIVSYRAHYNHGSAKVATRTSHRNRTLGDRLHILKSSSVPPPPMAEHSSDYSHQTGASKFHERTLVLWHEERPQMDPVDRPMNHLQKMSISSLVKHDIISIVPNGSNKSTSTNAYACFGFFINPIQPLAKHISYASWWRNVEREMNQPPDIPGKRTRDKQMFNRFIRLTKNTLK